MHDTSGTSGALRPLVWEHQTLDILDQTRLPRETRRVAARSVEAVAHAIRTMQVRGAPAIGIAAAAGMALAAREARARSEAIRPALQRAARLLAGTRPTAVNLRWGVERAERAIDGVSDDQEIIETLDGLVRLLLDEQWATDRAMSAVGAELLPGKARVITHCNTGALATGAYGTALGVIRAAGERGQIGMVYVDESRPRLQGARLTAWELERLGLPCAVIPDAAAAAIMAREEIDAVLVGADRIAANGDTANKIGTYGLAIAARYHGVPFYVVAPLSSIDPDAANGSDIPIEERAQDEVLLIGSEQIAPSGTSAINLAFDVTPAALITAIVTERGLLEPPFEQAIGTALGGQDRA